MSAAYPLATRRRGRERVTAVLEVQGETLVFRVARRLDSPNRWQGRHWRYKDNLTRTWERAMARALVARGPQLEDRSVIVRRRMKVTVARLVPSARNFIRDDDNLRFAVKPLNDALKRLGLIYQDARAWLEQSMPEQRVSEDGYDWTIVTVTPVEAVKQANTAVGSGKETRRGADPR